MSNVAVEFGAIRDLVRKTLQNPGDPRGWTAQGLGMLRTYLGDWTRLHVWDPALAVPNVSTVHDHPWHFRSLVVAGSVTNRLLFLPPGEPTHYQMEILCGAGGGPRGACSPVRLEEDSRATFGAGDTYVQGATEVHESLPEPGTVTLVTRVFLTDRDRAHVFGPLGERWVSAEPRPATADEVRRACDLALALF
jgi:hypothetical protein